MSEPEGAGGSEPSEAAHHGDHEGEEGGGVEGSAERAQRRGMT